MSLEDYHCITVWWQYLFHSPHTQRWRCLKYLFGILRNNYITCKFLTRCIIIRKHIKLSCLPQHVAMLFLPEVCFYASRLGRCENSNIIWRERELAVPLLYMYAISQRIVFDYSPVELFYVLSGAIIIILKFDWLKLYSALLTRKSSTLHNVIKNQYDYNEYLFKVWTTLIVVCEWNSSLIKPSTETIRNSSSCPGFNQRVIPISTSK